MLIILTVELTVYDRPYSSYRVMEMSQKPHRSGHISESQMTPVGFRGRCRRFESWQARRSHPRSSGGMIMRVPASDLSFGEHPSLLKKWFTARPAVQKGPKAMPKRYKNAALGPRTGGRKGREGVFQHADPFHALR
jgi:hypothetical protein